MKKAIKVSIPEPCHEDWGKMTQTDKGAFCKVCTKDVIDFTKTIDEDIVKYFIKNNNTCGRFSKSQLDRPLTLERSSKQKFAPLAASLLLPLTMMASSFITPKKSEIKTSTYTSLDIGSLNKKQNRIQVKTKGYITNNEGKPLSNVFIEVTESGKSTYTTADGYFSITYLLDDVLVFSLDGYEDAEYIATDTNESFSLQLKEIEHVSTIMGKMVAPEIIENEKNISEEINKNKDKYITITGTINDDNGLPLPGANIIIKDTTTGTQSDFDGNYFINAPVNSILEISYVGFDNETIQLSNINNTIDINMDGAYMGGMTVGIVITGYSTVQSYSMHDDYKHMELSHKQKQLRAKRQKREANTLAFKKLKLAKEKEARKKKRAANKKK